MQEELSEKEQNMRIFKGVSASRGFTSGPALLIRSNVVHLIPEKETEDLKTEIKRLEDAFALTINQIRKLSKELEKCISGHELDIFTGHLMMLDDPVYQDTCKKEIKDKKINAEWAVRNVSRKFMKLFSEMKDPYLRERAKDISDISRRIIKNLMGEVDNSILSQIKTPSVVVADDLTPSETISLSKDYVIGFVIDSGSPISHAALLARALGIPAVVGLRNFSKFAKTGDFILVNGNAGTVTINPTEEVRNQFEKLENRSRKIIAKIDKEKFKPGETADGHRISVLANVDASTLNDELTSSGAEGVGLYRSEYLWISLNREPTEEEQFQSYAALVKAMPKGQIVTFRVLDIGGDKLTEKQQISTIRENNPFLGNRSIRMLLRKPSIFRRQLRAMLRASALGKVAIMYPMIATLEELRSANRIVDEVQDSLRADGIPFDPDVKRGAMIEIPAAALIAEDLAKEVDFFSIGTNDLTQYTLAADRLNENVAHLYQPTHPAVLRLINRTIRAAHENHIPVSICGETASDPILATIFIGMGIDELSIAPKLIPLIKCAIRLITMDRAKDIAARVMGEWSHLTASEVYRLADETIHKKPLEP